MKRFFKYGVVPVLIFLFLLGATVIVLPIVFNVQKYIPEIEEKLSDVTGRSVSIGSNLGLSFFPWLSISFSNLKIGNPQGYLSDGFMKIESFEARVKILPLFKKELEIIRCVIGGLEVNLEKRGDGKANWAFSLENSVGETIAGPFSRMAKWSIPEDISLALFAITDGTLIWVDRTEDSRLKIDDLMLILSNVRLNNPVGVEFKASVEGKFLAVEGQLGTLDKKPGQGVVPVDLAVSVNNAFTGRVKGKLINLLEKPGYELDLHIAPFSARELFASLDVDFPIATADPTTFLSVEVDAIVKGDKEEVSIEKGKIHIDDTLSDILLVVKDYDHPDLDFTLDIDQLDLDRYLPPEAEKGNEQDSVVRSGEGVKGASDWRKINLAGKIKVKELKVGGGTANDINVNLHAADGIFSIDPSSFVFYQGRADTILTVDFQREIPQTSIDLKVHGVQALPLLHDFLAEDFMSGTVDTEVRLLFSGKSVEAMKTSLHADGTLVVKDGALEGIDMVNVIKNVAALPAISDPTSQKLRTDISELKSVFTIRKGVVASRKTTLDSPLAKVLISGTADLVNEQLEMVIAPNVDVVTMEEQGDQKNTLWGIPFTLSGPFAEAKIAIDEQYLLLDELKSSDQLEMQNLVYEKFSSPGDEDGKDLVSTPPVDPAVVAVRFDLDSEMIPKDQVKKQLTVGTGRVRISPLQEVDSWR